MTETIDEIIENFSFLTDWEDRYRYVIELGHELSPYPETSRDDVHKVPGCVSQVWLDYKVDGENDPVMYFIGDSDAHIVRGLVYILLALYSGHKASEILEIDAEALLKKLGLDENLTPQRSNGLRSMVGRVQQEARLQIK
ncbi:SufE family protein [Bartonella sp. HY329]|uniref:SufE family protein n=1 Tax=unclassified Bartonella TaxID=2645622 RepID=UPI0021CAB31F|nr:MULTISPECIES: SufE family protein [unclassified Bartonella]UXM94172.1 SufE family protein [Bartonella sp. HY329]UXN08494.1 SufE family protein [Bartonella sp. HY328]